MSSKNGLPPTHPAIRGASKAVKAANKAKRKTLADRPRSHTRPEMPTIDLDLDQQARAIMFAIVSVWDNFGANEPDGENALTLLCEIARQRLDMHKVAGHLSSSLNYFVLATLEDHNPEDLTICEMTESMTISLGL